VGRPKRPFRSGSEGKPRNGAASRPHPAVFDPPPSTQRAYSARTCGRVAPSKPKSDERNFRKERALTPFTDVRDTTAAVDAARQRRHCRRPADRDRYAAEAERMTRVHDPDDAI